ncbi:hypothetical protein GCM10007108_12440 [Thermogymnomonas acidicola]|uniref:SIS domain-containing protein n=1 Tax=Thermogymnomonas acidicola TaxID=399579 RepID=A0AA37F9M4_9ARCH|nr:SIS domain-containing protein [Thermogymnomonas acidicola]GGM75997.1 hypothetical protein GCM10007108_12440 [Thermogymnomonas acidicola]
MTDELPPRRSGHPYAMYDMLMDIPNGLRATVSACEDFRLGGDTGQILFTGNGTSYHSALVGSQPADDMRVRCVQAFELERFMRPSGTIIGISHTGKTKSTVDALRKHRGKCRTVGISHYRDSPIIRESDTGLVIGNSPDISLCNTKAFFDNAIASYILTGNALGAWDDWETVSSIISRNIPYLDRLGREMAQGIRVPKRMFVLGAGPNQVSARECAQKLKEATHLHAEGIELEEFNHGCTSVIDQETLVIIFSTPTVEDRVSDIVRACRETDTETLVVNGDGDHSMDVPYIDEMRSPFTYILSVYFFAYHLALRMGINPDYLRFEDERYLRYDSIVFPPGAH